MKKIIYLSLITLVILGVNAGAADLFDENAAGSAIVDCGAKSVSKAEDHYKEKIRALTIDIDEWARVPNRFEKKIVQAKRKRQVYYGRWLDILCRCKKSRIDTFEKSLCLSGGYLGDFKSGKPSCLVYN
jgi:hypothetical protein